MPAKKKDMAPLQPQDDYWIQFLKASNLLPQSALVESVQTVTKSRRQDEEKYSQINPEMLQFIFRVAERLTPIDGLDDASRKRCLNIRDEIRRSFQDVFEGRADFQKWFIETRRSSNLRDIDFFQLLYECLEGLNTPEARQLSQDYLSAIKKLSGL